MRRIAGKLLKVSHKYLYSYCRRYVDLYNSENDDNIHTNGELRLIRAVLPRCKTVFDVGANIGEWSKLALEIKPELRIHCFEPSPVTFRRLESCGFGPNVTINNFGMSSTAGELPLHVFSDGCGSNSLYVRRGLEDGWGLAPQTRSELVRLETLDRYCMKGNIPAIDFLKVDVEGHELEVFKGAAGMFAKGSIKCIQFEYGGCNIDSKVLLKDLFGFFDQYGYNLYKIYPDHLRLVRRYDQKLENFQYQNWAAIQNNLPLDAQGVPQW